MRTSPTHVISVGLLATLSLGFAIGLYAQAFSLDKLSDERVSISKMDWILLNTRIYVLEQTLKDDLSLPMSPTAYSYDSQKQKIRISVSVDPTWLAKKNTSQTTTELSKRATSLCVAPALADRTLTMAIGIGLAPDRYCSVRFFTLTLDNDGKLDTRDLAIFEDGKIVVK